jgi:photosystem II stability/assembly factor-like uncharacterized protein
MKKLNPLITITLFICFIQGYGQSWVRVNSPTSTTLEYCSFVNQDTGWVISADSVFKTTDGGITWVNQPTPGAPSYVSMNFESINFINANEGIICSLNIASDSAYSKLVGSILWTNDGGSHWVFKDLGNPNGSLNAKLASSSTAYAIDQYGSCKRTTDSGKTWSACDFTGIYSGGKLFPINKDTVFFAGLDNFHFIGSVGKTTDSGANWSVGPVASDTTLNAIYFCNYRRGWVGGYSGQILYTNNGGLSWVYTNSTSITTSPITDLAFNDTLEGWGLVYPGKIIHSTDGGINWSFDFIGTNPLFSLCFTKPDKIGYAVGDSGRVLKYLPNTAGIQNITNTISVNLFPNPNTGKFTAESSLNNKQAILEIYTVFGEKICTTTLSVPQTMIDLTGQPSGVYLCRLVTPTGKQVWSEKFSISK